MLETRHPTERHTCDDDRCITEEPTGRCTRKVVEGTTNCSTHNGAKQLKRNKREELYNYRVGQFLGQSDAQRAIFDKHKYSVSAELGISRQLLSKFLDKIEDDATLLTYNGPVSILIDKIQKLVESTLKADQKLGSLMSEEDAFALAQTLLNTVHEVLSEHIADEQKFVQAMDLVAKSFEDALNAEPQ